MENLPHYLSIIVVLILTGCGLPVPEEFPIIAAGVASSGADAQLNPWIALACCLIGALAGDSMLYTIGYHFGHNLVKAHPRLARLLHAEREVKMEQLLNQHGLKVLFLARFMVGVRAPVYLSIGILRISFKKFLLFDAFCATAVVSLFFGLSYLFGENVKTWIRGTEKVVTAVAIGAAVVALVVFWLIRRKRAAVAADPQPAPAEAAGRGPFGKISENGVPASENGSAAARRISETAAPEAASGHARED